MGEWLTLNPKMQENLAKVEHLVQEKGYNLLGWKDAHHRFSLPKDERQIEEIDCSLHLGSKTNIAVIDHTAKEIIRESRHKYHRRYV